MLDRYADIEFVDGIPGKTNQRTAVDGQDVCHVIRNILVPSDIQIAVNLVGAISLQDNLGVVRIMPFNPPFRMEDLIILKRESGTYRNIRTRICKRTVCVNSAKLNRVTAFRYTVHSDRRVADRGFPENIIGSYFGVITAAACLSAVFILIDVQTHRVNPDTVFIVQEFTFVDHTAREIVPEKIF